MVLSQARLQQVLGKQYTTVYTAIFEDPKVNILITQAPSAIQTWDLADPEAETATKQTVAAIGDIALMLAKISEMLCDQIAERDAIIAELRGAKMEISFGAPPQPSRWKRFLGYLNKL